MDLPITFLGAIHAVGTVTKIMRQMFGALDRSDLLILSNDAIVQRLSESLQRMCSTRMKLGQMMSIQDKSTMPSMLTTALSQVRKGAEAML